MQCLPQNYFHQFPTVCDYHDALYSVIVRDETEAIVARSPVMIYNNSDPGCVTVDLESGMQKDRVYTALINVTTAAGSTIKEVPFSESRDIYTII